MKEYKYYIFDFDGTLVDSMDTYVGVMLSILDKNGIKYKNDIVTLRWRNNMRETGIDEWVTDAFIGVDTNKWLRDRVSESISNEDTKLSLKAMQLDFDLSFFLLLFIKFILSLVSQKLSLSEKE